MALVLDVQIGKHNRSFLLTGEDVTVGTAGGNSLRVSDSAVDARHCVISLEGRQVFIRDLQSESGTWINGEIIREKTVVVPGDVIAIGRVVANLRDNGDEEPDLYTKWLGVPPKPRPVDHYMLLGVPPYADDNAIIHQSADQRMDILEQYVMSPDRALRESCQRMMNEIAQAVTTLTDPERRDKYNITIEANNVPLSSRLALTSQNPESTQQTSSLFLGYEDEPMVSSVAIDDTVNRVLTVNQLDLAQADSTRSRSRLKRRKQTQGAGWLAVGVAAVGLAVVALFYAANRTALRNDQSPMETKSLDAAVQQPRGIQDIVLNNTKQVKPVLGEPSNSSGARRGENVDNEQDQGGIEPEKQIDVGKRDDGNNEIVVDIAGGTRVLGEPSNSSGARRGENADNEQDQGDIEPEKQIDVGKGDDGNNEIAVDIAGGARVPPGEPIPTEQERTEALRLIREIFKEEYSQTKPTEILALADRLISQAIQATDSLPIRYVLLNEARALSIKAREPDLAFRSVNEITKVFSVDGTALRANTLDEISKHAVTPEVGARMADEYLILAKEYIHVDNIQKGMQASASAERLANKAKNLTLYIKAKEQTKHILELKTELQKISMALSTLKENPEDPKANEAVGQYKCFVKRDWEAGLPLLSKGTNAVLKELALADISRPVDTQSQMKLGDTWWEYGQKSPYKSAILERAQMWYLICRPNLSGLMLTKVDLRLVTLPAALANSAATGTLVAKLLQGKQAAQELNSDAFVFDLPNGDGRRGANGFWISANRDWEAKGTRWDLQYQRSGTANGIQLIHPWKTGHVMITVSKEGVHVFADGQWSLVGHWPGGPGIKSIERTPEYASVFPLTDEKNVRIVTNMNPTGILQIYVADKLVASGVLNTALPLKVNDQFISKVKGVPMPLTMPVGHAGAMIGPLDGGVNKAQDIYFYPIAAGRGGAVKNQPQ